MTRCWSILLMTTFLGAASGPALAGDTFKQRYAAAMALQADAPDQAAAELRVLAEAGYARASERLAYASFKGLGVPRDVDAAIGYYLQAIEAGRMSARVSLGKVYLGNAQPREARDMLRQAARDGDMRAGATLAWAHASGRLGELSQKARGLATLRDLAARDQRDAQMFMLDVLARRPEIAAQSDAVINRLHERYETGDAKAAEALLRYYRMRGHPRGTLEMRAELLQAPKIRDKIRIEEGLYLARDRQPGRFWPLSEELVRTAPKDVFARALAVSARINKNAYVRIVQQELRALGYRVGRPSPYLNAPLVRAINRFCRDTGIAETCAAGPLKSQTVKAVGAMLAEKRAVQSSASSPG